MQGMYKTPRMRDPDDRTMTDPAPRRFDTRIAVVLRDGLEPWQELNVTAFVTSGIAAEPGILGESYLDADGIEYAPMLRQPVVVLAASAEVIAQVHGRALERGLRMAIYPEGIFGTGNDDDNRALVRGLVRERLALAGLALHGPRNVVDRIVKAARLHP